MAASKQKPASLEVGRARLGKSKERHVLLKVTEPREPAPERLGWIWAATLGLLLFQLTFGVSSLSSQSKTWRSPPPAAARTLAGAAAVQDGPWTFPLAATQALDTPASVSIAQNDGVAWVTLGLKALHLQAVSPVGLFLLLAYGLQGAGMLALLKAVGVRHLASLSLGVSLALLAPGWIVAPLQGTGSAGEGLVLLGLATAVASARHGLSPRRVLAFVWLSIAAIGLWPSLVLSIGVSFVAAVGSELLQSYANAAVRRRMLEAVVRYGLAIGVTAFVLGWGEPGELPPVGQSRHGSAGLGFGTLGLFLVTSGLVIFRRRLQRDVGFLLPSYPARLLIVRFGPLGLALVALALLQVTGAVATSPSLLPPGLYLLIALSILHIDQSLPPRAQLIVTAALLLAQVPFGAAAAYKVKTRYQASPPPYLQTLDTPAADHRTWLVTSATACSAPAIGVAASTWPRLALLALQHQGAISWRPGAEGCALLEQLRTTLRPGGEQVIVLLGPPGAAAAAGQTEILARSDCYGFEAGMICGANLTSGPGLEPVAGPGARHVWIEDEVIPLDQGHKPANLARGWSVPEPRGIWSDGPEATLAFPAPDPSGLVSVVLELEALGFSSPNLDTQQVDVIVNDARLVGWRVTSERYLTYSVAIPPRLIVPKQPLVVRLALPNAASPAETIPGAVDHRRLGIGIRRITLSHVAEVAR